MSNNISFEVRLPRGYRVASIDDGSRLLLDDAWKVVVREGYRKIDMLTLAAARAKYC